MSILSIGFEQSPQDLMRPREYGDTLASQTGPERRQEITGSLPVDRAEIARGAQEYQRLMALHQRFFAAATTIRTMDKAMKAIGAMLSAAKSETEGPVKDFPPFPPGSEERAQRLREYTGLRALMDKLSFSPEGQAGMPKVQPRTVGEPAIDDWTYAIEQDGHTRTVLKEDIDTGLLGLHLPELTTPESGHRLDRGQLIQYLEDAGAKLRASRQRLVEQTVGVPDSSSDRGTEEAASTWSGYVRKDIAELSVGLAQGVSVRWEQLLG